MSNDERAEIAKDYALEKAGEAKDFIVEKAIVAKDFLAEKLDEYLHPDDVKENSRNDEEEERPSKMRYNDRESDRETK